MASLDEYSAAAGLVDAASQRFGEESMAVDDVYVLTVSATTSAGIIQNSLAFNRTVTTEPISGDFSTLAIAVKEIIRAQQTTALSYSSWKARQVRGADVTWPSGTDCNPIGGKLFEGLFTSNQLGLLGGDVLPPQCAAVVTLRTAQIGRRRRGRFYHGGMSEVNQNNGVWSSGLLTPLDAGWLSFFNTYTPAAPASGFRLGIWSYRTASGCETALGGKGHVRIDPPSPATAFEPCTTYVVRPTVYTQRRRVAGVGR